MLLCVIQVQVLENGSKNSENPYIYLKILLDILLKKMVQLLADMKKMSFQSHPMY